MRPVNLIPPDERRGESAPSRTGALSWVIVGGLAAILFAVTALVLIGKDVRDKEAQVASLERQEQELQARAASLSSFVQFKQSKQAREETISSLAQTRFDWERVMRELSRVLPNRAWLVNLTGSVTPEVSLESSANIGLRDSIPGPALQLIGCARSQEVVARVISSIGDIDGVTRVAVQSSKKADGAASTAGGSKQVSQDCRTRNFLARFELVAAFDTVPVPGSEEEVAPAPAPDGGTTPEPPPSEDGGVDDAQQARADQRRDTAGAKADAQQAANIVPQVGG